MSHQSQARPRRIVLLTEGHSEPVAGKTASCLLRYCSDEVVALLDSTAAGRTAGELFGVGAGIPVVASLADAPSATELVIGIAPSGGRVPPGWKPVLFDAIRRGMRIVSGLHEFLSDDPELAAAAAAAGAELVDVRKNDERDVASRQGLREDRLRLLTIGQDCSVGKMLAAAELTRALVAKGHDAAFLATGQTGIMIAGDGCPIDRVISDFVNGAVEKLVKRKQDHEILVIEGQASITHPRYSGVSLGLLHGAAPHGMILVYEVGRSHHMGMPHEPLPALERVVAAYEQMASFVGGGRVIGVAMNTRLVSPAEAAAERKRVAEALGIPACDPIRDGCEDLVAAVETLQAARRAGAEVPA
ncbi:MAG: hypothetical protein RLZZ440_2578 [Planctomycetota bacterium]|jgi:uncharacterized NAD-dependent epimerase/dehydratase family protein